MIIMGIVTATEYRGYHIAFFNGAWRICGGWSFYKFDTIQKAKDYIDALIECKAIGGYF